MRIEELATTAERAAKAIVELRKDAQRLNDKVARALFIYFPGPILHGKWAIWKEGGRVGIALVQESVGTEYQHPHGLEKTTTIHKFLYWLPDAPVPELASFYLNHVEGELYDLLAARLVEHEVLALRAVRAGPRRSLEGSGPSGDEGGPAEGPEPGASQGEELGGIDEDRASANPLL